MVKGKLPSRVTYSGIRKIYFLFFTFFVWINTKILPRSIHFVSVTSHVFVYSYLKSFNIYEFYFEAIVINPT